jgi:hypothetical protein
MDKHRGKATVFMFATGLKPRRRGANGIFGCFSFSFGLFL